MVASAPELTVGVLGPLQVAVDGVEAQVPAGNQRRLLASLLLGRSRVVPAQRLVEDVWGLEPPEATHASLHTTVARLRRSLGPAGQRVGIGPGGYALDVTDRYRDDGRFVHLLTAAREARGEERVGQLDQALALWRGDAWQEFRDDLAAAEARQLEEMRWQAWGNLAEAMTEVGRVDEAVSWLRGLVSRRPLHERTVGLLVEALDRAGAVQEALAEYAGFRERLAEQMGLDPSPRLAELHARVLRRERSSEALVLTGPGSPGETPASFGSVPPAGAPLGREDLIAMVLDRLQRESLVTLVGPGGVGKTTVAAAVAGRAEEAWWVDLMAVAPGDDLLELLVTQTGGRAGVGTDSAELLEQRLATARGLLVLDNCEHLVDGLADLVAQVLHGAPEVRVLATSRHRLGVAGERILPVPPLRVEGGGPEDPPAVALFLQRAAEVEPGLVVDSRARGAAAGICRRLDGLPLAIELAAGQAGSVSLTDLATHLAEQVDLLHATGHAGHERPRRHQTLRDTMRWSYDLLDPVEQQVFRGLGVFAAEFELAAAQLVVSALGVEHGRVAVVVADLVRRSMVVAPSPVGRVATDCSTRSGCSRGTWSTTGSAPRSPGPTRSGYDGSSAKRQRGSRVPPRRHGHAGCERCSPTYGPCSPPH